MVFTSWSSANRPSWTALIDTIAATGLLIDAAWNIVSTVTGDAVPASARPYPLAQSILKSLITAMLTPGTLCFFNSASISAASIGPVENCTGT
jgi:hypothetical protein